MSRPVIVVVLNGEDQDGVLILPAKIIHHGRVYTLEVSRRNGLVLTGAGRPEIPLDMPARVSIMSGSERVTLRGGSQEPVPVAQPEVVGGSQPSTSGFVVGGGTAWRARRASQ